MTPNINNGCKSCGHSKNIHDEFKGCLAMLCSCKELKQ